MHLDRPTFRFATSSLIAASSLALLGAAYATGCGGSVQTTSTDGGGTASEDSGTIRHPTPRPPGDDSGTNGTSDGDVGDDDDAQVSNGDDGGPPPPVLPFQLGAYDGCAFTTFLTVPGGGGMSSFEGSVMLTQTGSTLHVNYGGDGGALTASLDFAQTTVASAALAAGQQIGGVDVVCGPLDDTPTVAQLASGSLTYNAGTLFVSAEGTAEPVDAGEGCSSPGGGATIAITCSAHEGDAGAASGGSTGSDAGGGDFVGVYTCTSSTMSIAPNIQSSGGGANGTLAITEKGGVLTAAYNDIFVGGSLEFLATSADTAVPARTNQTMQVSCSDYNGPPPSDGGPGLNTLPVAASTLTMEGSSVLLSFEGALTANSGCPGAVTSVTVFCAKGQ
jgi:hypothetical protein